MPRLERLSQHGQGARWLYCLAATTAVILRTQSLALIAIIALVALVALASTATAQTACTSSQTLSCALYTDCIERNCNCAAGRPPYSGTFGLKYCSRFASAVSLTPAGQAWRDKTLICLRDRASRAYVDNAGPPCDCKAIQAKAIASHSDCYTSNPSFCALPDDDLRQIADIVDGNDVFALGISGVWQTGYTLLVCMRQAGVNRGARIAEIFLAEESRSFTNAVLDAATKAADASEREVRAVLQALKAKLGPPLQLD